MVSTTQSVDRQSCAAADARDDLMHFKDRFDLPSDVIYLDGNSLGALPVGALERAQEVITAEWGNGLIRSWNTAGWFDLPRRLGDKLGRLIGARAGETVVTDSTSLNLFKTIAAGIRMQQVDHPVRRVILTERDNFPTDIYVAQGISDFLNSTLDDTGNRYEVRLLDDELPLEDALDESVAVVALSHANYRTGSLWDMAEVTAMAHERGAVVIWDLCHSAGAVPIDLTAAGADFAIGCTYKYLNGGPGSPAFIWVNPRHQERFWQPLSGWWGHADPFAMADAYAPAEGISRFLCGTQPITSMAMIEPGLDMFLEADMSRLRAKSLELTDLFIELVEQRCGDHPLELITPRDHDRRGSHVSFRHPDGYPVMNALIARGVIGDYREPEVLRFGITPLYLSRTDIWDAVEALRDVLDSCAWDTAEFKKRHAVT
ncbi:kynureninase [Leekyejoonella antrihumi]|uniref:Kynureninase n=1 Tax=Leekyejoonella antrihumi TaxID=1660198 RepID=A0A563E5V8_9MICO|nr:kynureninase [Leekyejoonella antrihumi]TWP37948.1 kynureninase [Leekyejoonella antrihumi]